MPYPCIPLDTFNMVGHEIDRKVNDLAQVDCRPSNHVVGGSNPSGRAYNQCSQAPNESPRWSRCIVGRQALTHLGAIT